MTEARHQQAKVRGNPGRPHGSRVNLAALRDGLRELSALRGHVVGALRGHVVAAAMLPPPSEWQDPTADEALREVGTPGQKAQLLAEDVLTIAGEAYFLHHDQVAREGVFDGSWLGNFSAAAGRFLRQTVPPDSRWAAPCPYHARTRRPCLARLARYLEDEAQAALRSRRPGGRLGKAGLWRPDWRAAQEVLEQLHREQVLRESVLTGAELAKSRQDYSTALDRVLQATAHVPPVSEGSPAMPAGSACEEDVRLAIKRLDERRARKYGKLPGTTKRVVRYQRGQEKTIEHTLTKEQYEAGQGPRKCANPYCGRPLVPGKSRHGRCDACSKYWDRNGTERPERLCHSALTS